MFTFVETLQTYDELKVTKPNEVVMPWVRCSRCYISFLHSLIVGFFFFVCLFVFFAFLEPHLQHMEVPRLGVELELHTATATLGSKALL